MTVSVIIAFHICILPSGFRICRRRKSRCSILLSFQAAVVHFLYHAFLILVDESDHLYDICPKFSPRFQRNNYLLERAGNQLNAGVLSQSASSNHAFLVTKSALVIRKNALYLSQSVSSNFVLYVIRNLNRRFLTTGNMQRCLFQSVSGNMSLNCFLYWKTLLICSNKS